MTAKCPHDKTELCTDGAAIYCAGVEPCQAMTRKRTESPVFLNNRRQWPPVQVDLVDRLEGVS